MSEIHQLRNDLHNCAELAFQEIKTAQRIKEYISKYRPDFVIEGIATTGLAFVFSGEPAKPKIMIRAELDATVSSNSRAAHICGHDGHMAVVAALASKIVELKARGDIILFFQPAEETGQGAKECLQDIRFRALQPDYIFAFHNLPEFPLGEFILRDGTFACASVGLDVIIEGNSSHAAYPEAALNPIDSFEKLRGELKALNNNCANDLFLSTITHLKLGEENFGVTPGKMNLYLTLRAERDQILANNKAKIIEIIKERYPPPYKVVIKERESFLATINKSHLNEIATKALEKLDFNYRFVDQPFRWSEDFGHYTKQIDGSFIGIGAGLDTPLHHQEYCFNDDILKLGVEFFLELIEQVNYAA